MPLTTPVPNNKFPPVMLAVVVMAAADTRALTTLPLKLIPVAFRLPPVMLLAVLIGDATLPVKLIPTAFRLPAVILPTRLIRPPVSKFPPVMLPTTLSAVPDVLAMATRVAVLNVTSPAAVVSVTGPTLMFVLDPSRPPTPKAMVLVLPVPVAALDMLIVCVAVDCPTVIVPL